MPWLPYRPEPFPAYLGSSLTQLSELFSTWDELVRAAITVGRRNWTDVLRYGTYSMLEALWRVAIVRANLVEDPDGRVRQSAAFRSEFKDAPVSERGAQELEAFLLHRLQETSRTGLDGVTVEHGDSWKEEFMRREPRDRAQ
jgi:hypothetical protein